MAPSIHPPSPHIPFEPEVGKHAATQSKASAGSASLHIISASTSGSTEYVVETLKKFLREDAPAISVEIQRAEEATADDLKRGDVLVLASGTWNTGGHEGQLNPHMHQLLKERAKDIDLAGKPMAFISLGDSRYYFTTRCTEHFMHFLKSSKGKQLLLPLVIVNEPYGQEKKINEWGQKIITLLAAPAQ